MRISFGLTQLEIDTNIPMPKIKRDSVDNQYGNFLSKLENQFPSIKSVFQEGASVKRRRAPRYLRDDQPKSKFIVRSDALCSGYGKNKLVKPADQIIHELEKHRIHKEPRRPRKASRKKRANRKRKHRKLRHNKSINVPRRHQDLKDMIVLGDTDVITPEVALATDLTDEAKASCKDDGSIIRAESGNTSQFSVKHNAKRSPSLVETSLLASPKPSTTENSKFIAQPGSHMSKLLQIDVTNTSKICDASSLLSPTRTLQHTANNMILSPEVKNVVQKQINKPVVVGSPWSSLAINLEETLQNKLSKNDRKILTRNVVLDDSPDQNTNPMREQHFATKDERLVHAIEGRLHNIVSEIEVAKLSDPTSFSHLVNGSSSKNIVNRHVMNLSSVASYSKKVHKGDDKLQLTKGSLLHQVAHNAVYGKRDTNEMKLKLANKNFIELNKSDQAILARSPSKRKALMKKMKLKKETCIRSAKLFREQKDLEWGNEVKKRKEERLYRIHAEVRIKETRKRQQEWLLIIFLAARCEHQHYILMQSKTKIAAIRTIQRYWRASRVRSKGKKYWKTMWTIKRWMGPLIQKFRESLKHRAADKIKIFLNDHKDADVIITSIKKFRYKIVRAQRKFRAWSKITKARVQLLCKLWTEVEAEMHADKVQGLKKELKVRLVKRTEEGYVKDERFERKKKAIELVADDTANINRIEKHLEAMSHAKDAYHQTIVSKPTKSQFPKSLIKKSVMEYLRKRREQHGTAFLRMKEAEMRAKAEEATVSQRRIPSSMGKAFTTKEAKHILSMIHTEEEEETLSELHLHEKRQKLKKHLGRVLKSSRSSQWPPMYLLQGNYYGPMVGRSNSAREDMRDVIRNAQKKFDKILRERRKKALDKRKQKDALKSSTAAKALRDEALKKDYFIAMTILGYENS